MLVIGVTSIHRFQDTKITTIQNAKHPSRMSPISGNSKLIFMLQEYAISANDISLAAAGNATEVVLFLYLVDSYSYYENFVSKVCIIH